MSVANSRTSRKRVEDIIVARFKQMFDLIDKHLRAMNRKGPLPAGIILSGGGAGQGSIADIAKGSLHLPAKIADIRLSPDTKLRDATWAVAYGLALWGLTGETEAPGQQGLGKVKRSFSKLIRQFLP